MRAATSVLTLISACVVTAVVTVAVMNNTDNMDVVQATSPVITHTHEASSIDFSAEAAQLVVSRA